MDVYVHGKIKLQLYSKKFDDSEEPLEAAPQRVVQKAVLSNHTANLQHENINSEELFQWKCNKIWLKYLFYTDVLL